MRLLAVSFLAVTMTASAALAADAEFHPSTYTTYKKLGPSEADVKVLEALPPVGKYIEIGLVRVGTDKVSDYDEALNDLKKATAAHGGTAIVLEDDSKIFASGGTTSRGTRPINATATAIVEQ